MVHSFIILFTNYLYVLNYVMTQRKKIYKYIGIVLFCEKAVSQNSVLQWRNTNIVKSLSTRG
jgi:hypothetical protein